MEQPLQRGGWGTPRGRQPLGPRCNGLGEKARALEVLAQTANPPGCTPVTTPHPEKEETLGRANEHDALHPMHTRRGYNKTPADKSREASQGPRGRKTGTILGHLSSQKKQTNKNGVQHTPSLTVRHHHKPRQEQHCHRRRTARKNYNRGHTVGHGGLAGTRRRKPA